MTSPLLPRQRVPARSNLTRDGDSGASWPATGSGASTGTRARDTPVRIAGRVAALGLLVAALAAPAASGADSDAPVSPTRAARLVVPLPGSTEVLRAFEAPPAPWAAGHRGVDLSAVVGGDVLAPGDGVVTFAGRVAGRPVLTIALAGGLRSSVEPVVADVAAGDHVSAGEVVGALGPSGGHCATACLHWGVRSGRSDPPVYLDPMTLVGGAGPIVLLPDPVANGAAWP